jgi:nucleotide-binding universal stress UspA family protein
MTGSIICGVDDSESAKGAARVARELSARLGLRLVFVRVVEDASTDAEIAAVTARLQHFADDAADVDRDSHWLVDVGHPADRLVAAAEEESAALIVVGSTGPRSSLLGSISADVSRRAPCPVVVVAPGADRSLPMAARKKRSPESTTRRASPAGSSASAWAAGEGHRRSCGTIRSSVGKTKAEPSCTIRAGMASGSQTTSEETRTASPQACSRRSRRRPRPPRRPLLVSSQTGSRQMPAELDASVVKRLVERPAGSAATLGEDIDRYLVQGKDD